MFWEYYTPYRQDVATTLEDLRQQEFAAGRFHLSNLRPATIHQANINSDADGTRSILDIEHVTETPDFASVSPLSRARLIEAFGTDRPDRQTVERVLLEANEALEEALEEIERGEGRYVIIYDGESPTEVFFCGFSCD
jgi:hypothetical protein